MAPPPKKLSSWFEDDEVIIGHSAAPPLRRIYNPPKQEHSLAVYKAALIEAREFLISNLQGSGVFPDSAALQKLPVFQRATKEDAGSGAAAEAMTAKDAEKAAAVAEDHKQKELEKQAEVNRLRLLEEKEALRQKRLDEKRALSEQKHADKLALFEESYLKWEETISKTKLQLEEVQSTALKTSERVAELKALLKQLEVRKEELILKLKEELDNEQRKEKVTIGFSWEVETNRSMSGGSGYQPSFEKSGRRTDSWHESHLHRHHHVPSRYHPYQNERERDTDRKYDNYRK